MMKWIQNLDAVIDMIDRNRKLSLGKIFILSLHFYLTSFLILKGPLLHFSRSEYTYIPIGILVNKY